MFCENCGFKIEGYAAFCPKCGSSVEYTREENSLNEIPEQVNKIQPKRADNGRHAEFRDAPVEKPSFPNSKVLATILGVCLVGSIGFIMYQNDVFEKTGKKGDSITIAEIQTTDNTDNSVAANETQNRNASAVENNTSGNYVADNYTENSESQTSVASDGDPDVDVEYHSEDTNAEYGINTRLIEDYSENLDLDDYELLYSGIGDYNFRYPKNLFNNLTVDDSSDSKLFGNNRLSYNFSGSKGSVMNFTVLDRTDNKSLTDMARFVADYEEKSIYDSAKIKNSLNDDYATIVYTGYTDSNKYNIIYDLIRVDYNYVYVLHMITPAYTSEEDKIEKGYVTECVYRYCGWSGSQSYPRSYSEYYEYNAGRS